MAICNNCGAQLPDNGKFCTTCGAKAGEAKAAATTAANSAAAQETPVMKEKKPINKKLFIIIGAAVLALAVIITAVVIITNIAKKKAEIKAKTITFEENYINLVYDGYDTMGTVKVELTKKFEKAAYAAMGCESKKEKERAEEEYVNLKYALDIEVSKTKDLTNGDEITVTIKVLDDKAAKKAIKEADVIIKEATFTFKVEGLQEVVKYNPFDDLVVSEYGMDGDVYVDWSYTGEYELYYYYFDCDQDYDLSIGDTYTLTVDEDTVDYMLDEYGILLTETSKTYTVETASKYLNEIDEISSTLLEDMQDSAFDSIEDEEWYTECTYDDDTYEYLGMYFMTLKEGEYGSENIAVLVYKVTATPDDDDYKPFTVYVGYECKELYESRDGDQWVDGYTYTYGKYTYIAYETWDEFFGFRTLDEFYDQIEYDFGYDYDIEISDDLSAYEEEVPETYDTIEEYLASEEGTEMAEADIESTLDEYGDTYSSVDIYAEDNAVTYEYTFIEEQEPTDLGEVFTDEMLNGIYEGWETLIGVEEMSIQFIYLNPDGSVVYDETFSNY